MQQFFWCPKKFSTQGPLWSLLRCRNAKNNLFVWIWKLFLLQRTIPWDFMKIPQYSFLFVELYSNLVGKSGLLCFQTNKNNQPTHFDNISRKISPIQWALDNLYYINKPKARGTFEQLGHFKTLQPSLDANIVFLCNNFLMPLKFWHQGQKKEIFHESEKESHLKIIVLYLENLCKFHSIIFCLYSYNWNIFFISAQYVFFLSKKKTTVILFKTSFVFFSESNKLLYLCPSLITFTRPPLSFVRHEEMCNK